MSVSRPALSLLHKVSPSPHLASPRRCFSLTSIPLARRRSPFRSYTQEELDALQAKLEAKAASQSPAYTAEQYDTLAAYYTPEQMAALRAAEESIDPRDMVAQGFFRRDGWELKYQTDLSRIHPVIDKPIRGPDPLRDPRIRPKTDEEMLDSLATRIGAKMRSMKPLTTREWFVRDKVEVRQKLRRLQEEGREKARRRKVVREVAEEQLREELRPLLLGAEKSLEDTKRGYSPEDASPELVEQLLVHEETIDKAVDSELDIISSFLYTLDEMLKSDNERLVPNEELDDLSLIEDYVDLIEAYRNEGLGIYLNTIEHPEQEYDPSEISAEQSLENQIYLTDPEIERSEAETDVQDELDDERRNENNSQIHDAIEYTGSPDEVYGYGNKDMEELEKEVYKAMHDPRTLFHAVDVDQLLYGSDVLAPAIPPMDDSYKGTNMMNDIGEADEEDPNMLRLKKQTGLTEKEREKIRVKNLVSHSVVNQTRMGKIRSLYFLTIAGNENGLLGIGEGKSVEVEEAKRQAHYAAIRNMKPIPRYENRTIYGEVKAKVGGTNVLISARPPGFGVRTQFLIFEMARAAGIKDLHARVGRSRNKMNTVKATYEALMKQRLPDEVARARGLKMVDVRKVYYGSRV